MTGQGGANRARSEKRSKYVYTPPVVYTNVYVHHRRSFAAHTSGGPENSWSMPAWAINWAIMEAVVEPKRSSILRGMGRSKILGDM